MSLFTDSDFISSVDMIALDPEVLSVASAEKLIIDTPLGIAAQACDELGQLLLSSSQHFSENRARFSLSSVVITSPQPGKISSLKRYGVYLALYLFYRAAFFKKQNDRYDKKRAMYEEEMRRRYWPRFHNEGVPLVLKPLCAPGAIHEFNVGVFDNTKLSLADGSNAGLEAMYDVAITWVDDTTGNGESGPSAKLTLTIPTGSVLVIDITNLRAPNGANPLNLINTGGVGQGANAGLPNPGNANGWNIYVGAQGDTLFLQTASPISIGTRTYTLPGAPILSGSVLGSGQYPDRYLTMQRMLMRG